MTVVLTFTHTGAMLYPKGKCLAMICSKKALASSKNNDSLLMDSFYVENKLKSQKFGYDFDDRFWQHGSRKRKVANSCDENTIHGRCCTTTYCET